MCAADVLAAAAGRAARRGSAPTVLGSLSRHECTKLMYTIVESLWMALCTAVLLLLPPPLLPRLRKSNVTNNIPSAIDILFCVFLFLNCILHYNAARSASTRWSRS